VQQALREPLVRLARRDLLEPQVLQEPMEQWVQQAQQAQRERQVHQEPMEQLVPPELQELMEQ